MQSLAAKIMMSLSGVLLMSLCAFQMDNTLSASPWIQERPQQVSVLLNQYVQTHWKRSVNHRYEHKQIRHSSAAVSTTNLQTQQADPSWESLRTFQLMSATQRPILVYVDQPRRNTYKPHYKQYVRESMQAWSDALNGRLQFAFTNDPSDAQIRFYWVPRFKDPYKAGLASFKVGDANVKIKTIGIPDREIKGNILHELGHVFGINGHSNNKNDIMAGFKKWNHNPNYNPTLSYRDKQAIRRLYSTSWQRGENLYLAIQ